LKKRLESVLRVGSTRIQQTEDLEREDDGRGAAEELVTAATQTTTSSDEDEDDALSYFAKLAQEWY